MAFVDDLLGGLFAVLGLPGILVALFLVFVVDAALFPLLPEVAIVLSYFYRPSGIDAVAWAGLLLGMAVAGEATGNTALYVFVRRVLIHRGRMPAWLERLMHRWIDFLIVRDERVILLNRIAPVVPLVGAFIAACRWSFRKSIVYVVVGATGKYALLLVLSGFIGISYDVALARWVSLGLVVAVVVASLAASLVYRRRVGLGPRRGA